MKLIYAVWNYWGPGCTYVTIWVCYLAYIWRSMRKMEREAEAPWHNDIDDEYPPCDTEYSTPARARQ